MDKLYNSPSKKTKAMPKTKANSKAANAALEQELAEQESKKEKRASVKRDKRETNKVIGANIRRARQNVGLTLEQLAELLGVTTGAVGLIERGERGIPSAGIMKVCDLLGISVGDLYAEPTKAVTVRDSGDKTLLKTKIRSLTSDLTTDELAFVLQTIISLRELKNRGEKSDAKGAEVQY